jgi:hypothetical protein
MRDIRSIGAALILFNFSSVSEARWFRGGIKTITFPRTRLVVRERTRHYRCRLAAFRRLLRARRPTVCKARGFDIATPDAGEAKPLHVLPVAFVVPQETGYVEATIQIETNPGTATPVRVFGDVAEKR